MTTVRDDGAEALYNIMEIFHHSFFCFSYLSYRLFVFLFVFFDGTEAVLFGVMFG